MVAAPRAGERAQALSATGLVPLLLLAAYFAAHAGIARSFLHDRPPPRALLIGLLEAALGLVSASVLFIAAGFAAMLISIPWGGPHGASSVAQVAMMAVFVPSLFPARLFAWSWLLAKQRPVRLLALAGWLTDVALVFAATVLLHP